MDRKTPEQISAGYVRRNRTEFTNSIGSNKVCMASNPKTRPKNRMENQNATSWTIMLRFVKWFKSCQSQMARTVMGMAVNAYIQLVSIVLYDSITRTRVPEHHQYLRSSSTVVEELRARKGYARLLRCAHMSALTELPSITAATYGQPRSWRVEISHRMQL